MYDGLFHQQMSLNILKAMRVISVQRPLMRLHTVYHSMQLLLADFIVVVTVAVVMTQLSVDLIMMMGVVGSHYCCFQTAALVKYNSIYFL